MEAVLPFLLVAQGVLAGVDTVLNHELLARLPKRPEARPELALHVGREAIWAVLLTGLAWFAWHGAFTSSSRTAFASSRRTSACCISSLRST